MDPIDFYIGVGIALLALATVWIPWAVRKIRRVFKRHDDKPYKVISQNKELICSHCGSKHFDEQEAQLNTAGMTFLGLDWANKSATVYICKTCGRLEWFLQSTQFKAKKIPDFKL